MTRPRRPAHEALKIDGPLVRKTSPLALDLNGIAKGYGVDRLAETLRAHGVPDALVGIDGEMRALGLRPDGRPWTIAIETPDPERRAPNSILALQDAAVATSGDYRHWVELHGHRLSHTMNPRRGAPLGFVTCFCLRCRRQLRRGRRVGHGPDGAWARQGSGTCQKAQAQRPFPHA